MELTSSGQTSKVVAVAWYQPNSKPTRTGFENKTYSDKGSLFGEYALTHVYAMKPENASGSITKPNYDVVPIMGSDVQLTSGKKYEMPCELYEQPNMQLGYFAKTMLRHEGADAEIATSSVTRATSLLSPSEQYNPRYVAHTNNEGATDALQKMGGDFSVPTKEDIAYRLGFLVGYEIAYPGAAMNRAERLLGTGIAKRGTSLNTEYGYNDDQWLEQ